MDVKAIPTSGSASGGPSRPKKPNFVIQENITIKSKNKIVSSTKKAKTPVKPINKAQFNHNDKDLVLGLKSTISAKISQTEIKSAQLTKQHSRIQKIKTIPTQSIAKTPENVPPTLKEKAQRDKRPVQTSKEVPSTSFSKVFNGYLQKLPPLRSKAIPSVNAIHKKWTNNTEMETQTQVDFEDIIPTMMTSKKHVREYALTSEVTLIRTNPKSQVDQEATQAKISQAKSAQTPRITLEKVSDSKKKLKKKKRRFRNMDGSEDEDDWPAVTPPATDGTSKVVTCESTSTASPNTSGSKPKAKIQILQNYIFPSPSNRVSPAVKKPELETVHDDHISDESVSSIHSKMSTISDFNINGSYGHSESEVQENIVEQEEVLLEEETIVLQVEGHDAEAGEIFCAYDDDGNLVCLQKGENGELIMLPTEQVTQEELIDGDNNNSFEVESKEKLGVEAQKQLEDDSVEHAEEGEAEEVKEDDASLDVGDNVVMREDDASPGILPETVENIGNEEIVAEATTPEEEVVTLPTGDANNEPIYILNDGEQVEPNDVVNIQGATPLEIAFLQSLAQSATTISVAVSPEKRPSEAEATPDEVVLAPFSTDLETLMKVQDQCRIVDYQPSDQRDQHNLSESISNVNELSQMDIAKMILGEGLGAMLVSDQADAVDLLQLPPDYKPKPVVLQPVVPVSVSPMCSVDKMAAVQSEPKQKRKYNRKQSASATSTPLKKNAKKKKKKSNKATLQKQKEMQIQMLKMNHVTGDSDVALPAPVGVSTPFKVPKKLKVAKHSPKVAQKLPKSISPIKSTPKHRSNKLNGASTVLEDSSLTSNSNFQNTSFSSVEHGISSDLNDSSVDSLATNTCSQSEASILSPFNAEPKAQKKKKRKSKWSSNKKKTASAKAKESASANNSSKENDYLDCLNQTVDQTENTSQSQDDVSPVDGSIEPEDESVENQSAAVAEHSKTESGQCQSLATLETLENIPTSSQNMNPKDDTANEDISLGDDTLALPLQDSSGGEEPKVLVKRKKAKQRCEANISEGKIHATRHSTSKANLSASISQVNLSNSEVSISTQGVHEDKCDSVLPNEESNAEVVEKSAENVGKSPAKSKKHKRDKTPVSVPVTANGVVEQIKSTPKSGKKSISKFPFKINFKNLIARSAGSVTPSPTKSPKAKHKRKKSTKDKTPPHDRATHDFHFEAEIKIKDDRLDASDGQPRVPKIILKLSPHKTPSIVRSPEKADATLGDTPQSKANGKKRKVFSPLALVTKKKKSSNSSSKVGANGENGEIAFHFGSDCDDTPQNVANISQPLYTDDPELVINLPIDMENQNKENVIHQDAELPDNEVKVKLEENFDDDDDEILGEVDPYHVGDLVMGRLGSFCFWPCMITREPDLHKFKRYTGNKVLWYHVRFFGDNGRRAWVPKVNIIKYDGQDTLKKHELNLLDKKAQCKILGKVVEMKSIGREIASCQVSRRMKNSWQTGMDEEVALVGKTIAERHEFFFEMFASRREKAVKRRRLSTETSVNLDEIKEEVDLFEVKEEPSYDTVFDEPPAKKRKIEKKPASPKVSKTLKKSASVSPKNVERRSTRSSMSTPCSSGKAPEIPEDDAVPVVSTNEQKCNYVIEDLELIIQGSLIMKNDGLGRATENKTPEMNSARGTKRKKQPEDEKKAEKPAKSKAQNDAVSEISDTDSSSKVSVQSTGNKRVLFKDVPRNPVCHVCFKTSGVVLKCKGSCFGFYHPECSRLKEEPKEEEAVVGSPATPKCSPPKVEIVSVKTKTKYFDRDAVNLNQSDASASTDLMDQLDSKLSKVMAPIAATTNYRGSTTDASSDDSACEVVHEEKKDETPSDFMCINCTHSLEPSCFSCGSAVYLEKHVERFRCSEKGCGKFFHKECLKSWPQALINVNDQTFSYRCPMHICQTCTSENPHAGTSLLPLSKSVRCLKCPGTYHINAFCVPAGTEILSQTHIICPRHVQHKSVKRYTINANWCFICSRGGDLMCCETCPTSVHSECISINLRADDTFVCEDCESGRLPLYDEIVWAKFAQYKWWPAVILFPEDVPARVRKNPHKNGEFVVRFYGTHDHHWFALGRVFLFQEDDKGDVNHATRKDFNFQKAVEEAKAALVCKKQLKLQRDLARRKSEKPPPFTRIRINRIIGNLKPYDGNVSSTNACNCNGDMATPCGLYSDCLNRLLMTECDPEVCPARDKCLNQLFEKRVYPQLVPYKTESRGWGLKSTEPLFKGQFVIEYVGELIDQEEYHRRIAKMNEQKAENYYFLTLDAQRTIDAGPKGNVARFMNHCCQPNCATQKWTVRGDTRVGLFALEDIPPNTELTFNYNMETIGDQMRACQCGAENCSGFLGAKNKEVMKSKAKKGKTKKITMMKKVDQPQGISPFVSCFICGESDADLDCTMRSCSKVYHIKCLEIYSKPQGKWTCPRHYCNSCAKKTIRSCISCLQSYCPMHAHGNITFLKTVGYACNKHNPDQTSATSLNAEVVPTSSELSNAILTPSHVKQTSPIL